VPVNVAGYAEPAPAQAPPPDAQENALERHIRDALDRVPSGVWGVYIEDLSTGRVIAIHAEQALHPASTIKFPLALAAYRYFDLHPGAAFTTAPAPEVRTLDQLVRAMLIQSDEPAAAVLEDYLTKTRDARPLALVQEWGGGSTTFKPRRTTASELGLLWKRFYRGELLSPGSTAALLEILRFPSAGDDGGLYAGLPQDAPIFLAHVAGATFESDLGVAADAGVVETGQGAYVIVVLANGVERIDFEAAWLAISAVSELVYEELK
jgi:hypothetical protein